jgi:Nif-specific regulatory protein
MPSFLVVTHGIDLDRRYVLDANSNVKIGRGIGCQVAINDPLSSRIHASIDYENGQWVLTDAGSRNGTLVNGSKVDRATLYEGCKIRIGNTELQFRQQDSRPVDDQTIETINLAHSMIDPEESMKTGRSAFAALKDRKRFDELYELYQLAFMCLSNEDLESTIEKGLTILRSYTGATVVGFLATDDVGDLKPFYIDPVEGAQRLRLSQRLTDLVIKQATAIWTKHELRKNGDDGALKKFSDAICIPMVEDKRAYGAIHLYRETEQFQTPHFDFAISAGNILGTAIIRNRRNQSLRATSSRLKQKHADFDNLIGDGTAMEKLKERILRISRANGTVLIRGESGVGKELVATAIHRASNRATAPMLTVNCAAIPSELMESQLFGHAKGAFTGADKDHAGFFKQADGGTLFLDEVGELNLGGQAKLLRILEGHPFLPVGSMKEIRTNVRVLVATNRDLRDFVREKRFREDLYYRLSTFELHIPPLRERGGDIDQLVDYFLDHFRHEHGRPSLQLSETARRKLVNYRWPGNVRQLRNVLDSAVVLALGDEISTNDLALHEPLADQLDTLRIEDWERRLIPEALKRADGKIPDAADLLGISRATLYRKLDTYGFNKEGDRIPSGGDE